MKLCLISDTHGKHYQLDLPSADVLVHAGDFTMNGGESAIRSFNEWLGEQKAKFKHIVIIAGNHDIHFHFRPEWAKAMITNAHYLEDSGVVLDGKLFYGLPWTTPFGYGWAFNADPEKMRDKLSLIPTETDVLITHGPAHSILDMSNIGGISVGCKDLAFELRRIKPEYHVFGHIHEANGMWAGNGTTHINASIVNSSYDVVNVPWIVEI